MAFNNPLQKDNNGEVVLSWLNIPSQYVRAPTFSSLLCDCFLEHKKRGSSLIASTRRVLQSQQGLRFITLISYCISMSVVVLCDERQEDTMIVTIDECLHHSVRFTFLGIIIFLAFRLIIHSFHMVAFVLNPLLISNKLNQFHFLSRKTHHFNFENNFRITRNPWLSCRCRSSLCSKRKFRLET
jgi:hypothetical protein